MEIFTSSLLPFFLLLLASLFFAGVLKRLHVPWVVALILGGMVIGPHGLGILPLSDTVNLIGDLGLVFLMFMAGLEIRFSSFRECGRQVALLSLLAGVIPFGAGFAIADAFGYDFAGSLLLGIIFIASSVSVIVPVLEGFGLERVRLGKTIIASAVVLDVVSLLALSVFFQSTLETAVVPLPVFYAILALILFGVRLLIPKVRWLFSRFAHIESDLFQQELRAIITILFGTVVLFELIGLHAIIAGFFAGLLLSESIQSEILHIKLRAISYGLFIPAFFVIVGARTDIGLLASFNDGVLVAVVVLGLMVAKFSSGWIAGHIGGFSPRENSFIGIAVMPHLSTALAVAFSGLSLGIIDERIITALVVLSVVTTLIVPILLSTEYHKTNGLRARMSARR